jgi:hypothetical protein
MYPMRPGRFALVSARRGASNDAPMHPRFALLLLLVALAPAALAADGAKAVRLFDGKTFHGWEGNQKWWRIEDGAFVGGNLKENIPNNEFLCTERRYTNFVLRLRFKLVGGEKANAGVQIRTERIPDHHEVIGYQADIGQHYWGALYDESRRKKILAAPPKEDLAKFVKFDDWNDYEIRCEGRRIVLKLNGHTTVDYTEPDESIPQHGLIALQVHSGPPTEAWYKDITIEELP